MKISLIIPAYNEEKYIEECLLSIQKNSTEFFEVILIDNKSTDKTVEIAQKFPFVKIIREEKQGPTYARQCGFENTTGDILAFIDADTKIPRDWVTKMQREFEKNKSLVCLSGPYIYYDMSIFSKLLVWICYVLLYMPAYFLIGYMAIGGNMVIKKSALEKVGGFNTDIIFYGDDTDIARRLSKVGKVKFTMSFYMHTSARRLSGEGIFTVGFKYVVNFISIVLRGKPKDSEYKNIR